MAIDPTRAILVSTEFRYTVDEEPSNQSKLGTTNEIVRETNLDDIGGKALFDELFAMTTTFARVFTITVEDILRPEDFITGLNRYTLTASRHPHAAGVTFTLVASEVDYFSNRTTLTVRG